MSTSFAEDTVSPPLSLFGHFVEYEVAEIGWAQVWILNFVPLIDWPVFVPMPGCFYSPVI